MFRASWLHNLLGMTRSGKDRHCQAAQQKRRVRLKLEPLEDRITPSYVANPHSAPVPGQLGDPRFAVANAIASEMATKNYLNQLINSFIHNAGVQASNSTLANGSTPTNTGPNSIGGALAALSQEFAAISKELSSTSFLLNEAVLMQLQLQQVQLTVQSQAAQHTPPSSTGIAVGPLTN